MDGRVYDPRLGRFLSPDPYVQDPTYSQSLNRYSYVWNNPLVYYVPSGYFFLTILTFVADFTETAFFRGGFDPTSKTAREKAWRNFDPTAEWSKTNHAFRIDWGLFITDPNRNFWGRSWQLISRWTWELPQTVVGNLYSHTRNMFGNVDRVDYFGGATFLTNENEDKRWGVSIGNYINISIKDEIGDDFAKRVVSDPLFMHEYGHAFDSQSFGFFYIYVIGLPSIISASNARHVEGEPDGVTTHDFRWYEMRANTHAAIYFKRYYKVDWSGYETWYPRKKRYKHGKNNGYIPSYRKYRKPL